MGSLGGVCSCLSFVAGCCPAFTGASTIVLQVSLFMSSLLLAGQLHHVIDVEWSKDCPRDFFSYSDASHNVELELLLVIRRQQNPLKNEQVLILVKHHKVGRAQIQHAVSPNALVAVRTLNQHLVGRLPALFQIIKHDCFHDVTYHYGVFYYFDVLDEGTNDLGLNVRNLDVCPISVDRQLIELYFTVDTEDEVLIVLMESCYCLDTSLNLLNVH